MKFLQAAEIGNCTNTFFHSISFQEKYSFSRNVWIALPIYTAAMEAEQHNNNRAHNLSGD